MEASEIVGRAHYALIIALAMLGLCAAAVARDFARRVAGVAIAWMAVALFFAASGYIDGAGAPALSGEAVARGALFANPVPQTAAVLAAPACAAAFFLGYAILVRIREAYGATDARVIAEADRGEDEERPA